MEIKALSTSIWQEHAHFIASPKVVVILASHVPFPLSMAFSQAQRGRSHVVRNLGLGRGSPASPAICSCSWAGGISKSSLCFPRVGRGGTQHGPLLSGRPSRFWGWAAGIPFSPTPFFSPWNLGEHPHLLDLPRVLIGERKGLRLME